jgi:hypothetical protein
MTALPPIESLAESIDEVIDRLTTLVDWAREAHSRLGYFAALYRKVTKQVREDIHRGRFDDAERMERFDVIFANRYLQALIDVRKGHPPSQVWAFSFQHSESYWPIVLQHLLLGMNAHINLDLGIAAAQTMRGRSLEALQDDFNKINAVLASLVDDVQKALAEVWLTLRLFNATLGSIEAAVIGFSMDKARNEAWESAERLWRTPDTEWPSAIREQDQKMMSVAKLVYRPGMLLGTVTHVVRLGEVQDVARVIDIVR